MTTRFLMTFCASAGLAFASQGAAEARELRTIWQFPPNTYPSGTLVRDDQGNLFGVTTNGGNTGGQCPAAGCGTVFELSPAVQNGQHIWVETTLYRFTNTGDGLNPTAGLIQDRAGALYGTTSAFYQGANTVFRLVRPAAPSTAWSEQTLASIPYEGHGLCNLTPLVLDKQGNLFGASQQGGFTQSGLIFRVSPPAVPGGSWTTTYPYVFDISTDPRDGAEPQGLTQDGTGGVFGTTSGGGQGYGTVFHLTQPSGSGTTWNLQTLAYEHGAYGAYPGAAPAVGADGALYVSTAGGGARGCLNGCGTLLEVSPPALDETDWSRNVAYRFTLHHPGRAPGGSLIADSTGAFFGVVADQSRPSSGSLYKLNPPAPGSSAWTPAYFYPIYDYPSGALVADASGALYGTTSGTDGSGRVFKFTGGDFTP